MSRRNKLFGQFAILSILLLSGCNLKEKIGENITEGIIEKATGGELDVELDGDEVTYSTEDGETVINSEDGIVIESEDGTTISSGSEYEWPTDQAAAYLPELNVGTVIYILNSESTCMISVEEVSEEDYLDYEEAIVEAGYTLDQYESSAEDFETYVASKENGIVASIMYTPSQKALAVTVDASAKTE